MHSSCVSHAAFVSYIYICGRSWGNGSDRASVVALAPTKCRSSRAEGIASTAVAGSQRGGLGSGCGKPWLFLIVEYACDNAWGRWFGLLILGLGHAPTEAMRSRAEPAASWGILPTTPDVVSNEWIVTSAWRLLQLVCSPGAGKGWSMYCFSLQIVTTFACAPH